MFNHDPIEYEDALFGLFKFDRTAYRFEIRATWSNKEINLRLSADDDNCNNPPSEALKVAHFLWEHQDEWNNKILNSAATKLLPLKNDDWLQKNEKKVTFEIFKSRMELTSIDIDHSSNFEFWFDDGDLFAGHAIRVDANLEEGMVDAGIHG